MGARGLRLHGAVPGKRERLAPYLAVDVSESALAGRGLASWPPEAVAPVGSVAASEPPEATVESMAAATLQALTPRLMAWADGVWLLDLGVCESYWLARAETQGAAGPVSLVRALLAELLGRGCRAALADHPWQALLLLRQMQERRLTGLVLGHGPFGDTLAREVSWDTWWHCADDLGAHLGAHPGRRGERRFDPALFRRQCTQMRRAVKRLGLLVPWQLREVEPAAIKRRFGATLRDLWQWAYGGPAAEAPPELFPATPTESGFPWRSFTFASPPRISRHLEEPLCEWPHLEPLLREDFDRLCRLGSWLAGERVVSLEWRLVLRDLSYHVIPVRFRHPHSLHRECGSHGTALLQALYAFEASQLRQRPRRETGPAADLPPPPQPLIGWELVLTERLTVAPRSLGLFGDLTTRQESDALTLLQLENKLPVRLAAFALQEDWLPEHSFGQRDPQARDLHPPELRDAYQVSLAAVALARPLYLYDRPQRFDGHGRSSLWRFSERTMGKWWQPRGGLQRDYYRLTETDGRALWVYKNGEGQCFVHGIFA